ncbi:metal-dependent hydrolase [Thalassotalea fusca]
MDVVTHLLVGATVAQLPKHQNDVNSEHALSTQHRVVIGALCAVLPDIDYLLFFINPFEFITSWHRAETHSIILIPLWAWLVSRLFILILDLKKFSTVIFFICLAAMLSHLFLDCLTSFGVQIFAPLSQYKLSWELLFVIDPYFTLLCSITCYLTITWHKTPHQFIFMLIPCSYLIAALVFKQYATQQANSLAKEDQETPSIKLFPQPFSPFYWQILQTTESGFNLAYVKLIDDHLAIKSCELANVSNCRQSYQLPEQLRWHYQSKLPTNETWQADASEVWQHSKFSAFHEFTDYAVFWKYQQNEDSTCVWFSDLRYHWPNITPSFRFGMCKTNNSPWQLYRMRYFSEELAHTDWQNN